MCVKFVTYFAEQHCVIVHKTSSCGLQFSWCSKFAVTKERSDQRLRSHSEIQFTEIRYVFLNNVRPWVRNLQPTRACGHMCK